MEPVPTNTVSSDNESKSERICRVCGGDVLRVVKLSNIKGGIDRNSFAISNSDYGVTGELSKCQRCGFIQCTSIDDVYDYYRLLEDPGYEKGRPQRSLQASRLMDTIARYKSRGRLLDIGAGSGILVEQAMSRGYQTQGVEPSEWLQKKSHDLRLPVILGAFPHPGLVGTYDIMTLVDVIEHVTNPVELLKDMSRQLAPGGIVVIVTPDVSALVPRVLRWRWWHFRVAHIGYFNMQTLRLAAKRADLTSVYEGRAGWYFPADYLMERVNKYLPKFLRITPPRILSRVTVPVNPYDSILAIFEKTKG
jgi:SAM-dependent methyltransferase